MKQALKKTIHTTIEIPDQALSPNRCLFDLAAAFAHFAAFCATFDHSVLPPHST